MEELPWKTILRERMEDAPDRGVRVKVLKRRCLEAAEQRLVADGVTDIDTRALKKAFKAKLKEEKDFTVDDAEGRVHWKPGKNPKGAAAAMPPQSVGGEKAKTVGKRSQKRLDTLAQAAADTREQQQAAALAAGGDGAAAGAAGADDDNDSDGDGDEEAMRSRGRGYTERWNKAPQAQRYGKFSEEEKQLVIDAVNKYAEEHDKSREDLSWLIGVKKGTTKAERGGNVWLDIAGALPHRSPKQVWAWGTRHFHPDNHKGKWSAEEDAELTRLVAEWGPRWTDIGKEIGRMPLACADRHRNVKDDFKKGKWSDEEVDRLKTLVEEVQQKLKQEGGRQENLGAMLANRDLLPWTSISKRLGGRSGLQCMDKWYMIAPRMIESGLWEVGEDKVLLKALYESGETQEAAVRWGDLVPGRDKATCIRRWKLIAKKVPDAKQLGFDGTVEYLVGAHMKDLLKDKPARQEMSVPQGGTDSDPSPAARRRAGEQAAPKGGGAGAAGEKDKKEKGKKKKQRETEAAAAGGAEAEAEEQGKEIAEEGGRAKKRRRADQDAGAATEEGSDGGGDGERREKKKKKISRGGDAGAGAGGGEEEQRPQEEEVAAPAAKKMKKKKNGGVKEGAPPQAAAAGGPADDADEAEAKQQPQEDEERKKKKRKSKK